MLVVLKGLEISCCKIGNAYLNTTCRENILTVSGSEFGSDKGKVMLIVRAIRGLRALGHHGGIHFHKKYVT